MSEEKALQLGFKPKAYLRCVCGVCVVGGVGGGERRGFFDIKNMSGGLYMCIVLFRCTYCTMYLGFSTTYMTFSLQCFNTVLVPLCE